MPLRQSTLKFGARAGTLPSASPAKSTDVQTYLASSPSADTDTIVVDTSEVNTQLPTPSESATDVSSESSQSMPTNNVKRTRSKRVSAARGKKSVFREDLDTENDTEQDKNRSISGATLVPARSSLESKVQEFLDVEPSSEKNDTTIQAAPADEIDHLKVSNPVGGSEDAESVITVREESEDEEDREERRAAKKAKMQENAKKWEQRTKAAEKNATRRSGRASLLSKASEIMDTIKNTVLGKRTRGATDGESESLEPRAKSRALTTSISNSPQKKQRTDESTSFSDQPIPKRMTTRREKKWLVSGLFAGQPRTFEARLNENKNKRKSKALDDAEAKENSVLPLPMFAGERLLKTGREFKLPFDVFSPLPPGQPKPDEWKKVNKNVFVGDAAAEWRTNKFVEHSKCLCSAFVMCGQDCMNRYMYYECDNQNCRIGPRCGNRAFKDLQTRTKIGGKYNIGVEVIKTEDRGYGVRSNRTFEPDQIIVEYTGEIITQEECERRMRTIYKDNACYYLMLFDQNMIIDATRGSMARFVNHSCEPNCRMEKWTVEGKPRMALFAGDRGIMTGEELTYDYNFDPYSQKNVQECRCGAKSCRGVLGPKPKPEAKRPSPEKEITKKKEGKLAGAKRKMTEVLEESTSRLNKKQKIVSSSKSKSGTKSKMPTSPISKKAKGNPVVKGRVSSTKTKSVKRTVLVKKVVVKNRKTSAPKPTTKSKLKRSDSKLKKILVGAKNKATGSLKGRSRVISSSSATEALLETNKKGRSSTTKRI